jgi:hypothetical protein
MTIPSVLDVSRYPLVFISGPLTRRLEEKTSFDNMCAALKVGDALLAKGYCPLVPHIGLMWSFLTLDAHNRHEDVWMNWCFAQILRSDFIFRLPGHSDNADREVAFAKSLGLITFHSLDEVPDLIGNP